MSAGCSRCGDAHEDRLYALTTLGKLCRRCWRELGCPWPAPSSATAEEVHQAELRIRDAMLARGGTDRHLVRNGRT